MKQVKKMRKFSALSSFQETLRELLVGVVDLPKSKNVNVDVEVFKAGLTTMFDSLMAPDNYHKMIRNEKARKLFESFLEIDMKPMYVSREALTHQFRSFVKLYRPLRNLPSTVIQFLLYLMAGDVAEATTEIYSDQKSVPAEPSGTQFVITKIQDSWLLSLIFLALPAASYELATGFLRSLNEFFVRQPQYRSKVFAEDKFQLWSMPILFDLESDDQKEKDHVARIHQTGRKRLEMSHDAQRRNQIYQPGSI